MTTGALQSVAQVHRSVDARGRVVYSDRPPTAAAASPALNVAPAGTDSLAGEWIVASATANGEAVVDDKIIGTVWTFKGSELTLRTRRGESQAYVVKTEPTGLPAAFTISPVMPSQERGGPLIYDRAGDRLRVAFIDGFVARPVDFQPHPKQVVLVLTAKSAAVGAAGLATAGPGRDACALLRKAGAHELLVAAWPANPKTIESSPSAGSCRVEGAMARIDLLLIPASSRVVLDGERAKEVRDMPHWASKGTVEDEPALGPGAFVVRRGNSTVFMALKGETAVRIAFAYPQGHHQRMLDVSQRVIAGL